MTTKEKWLELKAKWNPHISDDPEQNGRAESLVKEYDEWIIKLPTLTGLGGGGSNVLVIDSGVKYEDPNLMDQMKKALEEAKQEIIYLEPSEYPYTWVDANGIKRMPMKLGVGGGCHINLNKTERQIDHIKGSHPIRLPLDEDDK